MHTKSALNKNSLEWRRKVVGGVEESRLLGACRHWNQLWFCFPVKALQSFVSAGAVAS